MKKKLIIVLVFIIVLTGGYYIFFSNSDNPTNSYEFVDITRGNINTIITSSGVIEPVSVIDIGTQVSGKIDKINIDFNTHVRKGQLLAIIDTTFLSAAVNDAKANLEKSEAQLEQAISQHNRNIKLYEKTYISDLEFINSKTLVSTSKANVQSAKSSLDRAVTNLKYAFIYSPINGIVINRNVEEGQTVAASLQAPTLFTIAEDLSKMKILGLVDESDIGNIKLGQEVNFTVQSFIDKTFKGVVSQIRLQPETIQNVVNYTVVIQADNKEGLLFPGMTATVDFFIEKKENVLVVSSSALKFKPTQEQLTEYQERMKKRIATMRDSLVAKYGDMSSQFGGRNGLGNPNSNRTNNSSQLWYFDEKGELQAYRVILGSTDGKQTEIVRGRGIKEGLKVINKMVAGNTTPANNNSLLNSRGLGGLGRGR